MRQIELIELEPIQSDVVYTPDDVARDVVSFFCPSGRVLDPCKGKGAFLQYMPDAEWCEIREGVDFFAWDKPVDWIVSNPPFNKPFNSDRMMKEIWAWGGIVTILVIGPGAALNFPIGFCIGAVHFKKGYHGGINIVFRDT